MNIVSSLLKDIEKFTLEFFPMGEKMRGPKVEGEFKGLKLPKEVLEKFTAECKNGYGNKKNSNKIIAG